MGQARFCPACGAPAGRDDGVSNGRHAREGARNSAALIALAGAAVGIVIVLLVLTVLFLRQSGGPDSDQVTPGDASPGVTGSSSPSTPTTTAEPGGVETPLQTPPPGDQDVGSLPAGLYCRDLHAQGYSYSASVDYWRLHGQPNRMDADRNGIPCETVYPVAEVDAFWSP